MVAYLSAVTPAGEGAGSPIGGCAPPAPERADWHRVAAAQSQSRLSLGGAERPDPAEYDPKPLLLAASDDEFTVRLLAVGDYKRWVRCSAAHGARHVCVA